MNDTIKSAIIQGGCALAAGFITVLGALYAAGSVASKLEETRQTELFKAKLSAYEQAFNVVNVSLASRQVSNAEVVCDPLPADIAWDAATAREAMIKLMLYAGTSATSPSVKLSLKTDALLHYQNALGVRVEGADVDKPIESLAVLYRTALLDQGLTLDKSTLAVLQDHWYLAELPGSSSSGRCHKRQ